MAAWSYNAAGTDAKAAIVIPGNANLMTASSVDTREPGYAIRQHSYSFPGLTGVGMTAFGAAEQTILCRARLEAATQGARRAFEMLWGDYRTGGQYTLVDEYGRTYHGVRFIAYRPIDREIVLGSGAIVWDAEIEFAWLRPAP